MGRGVGKLHGVFLGSPKGDYGDGTCKLDMVCALLKLGWKPKASLRRAWSPGHPNEFNPDWRRPNTYFVCLLECDRLLAKGVQEIPHAWKVM